MRCVLCGEKLADGTVWCPECGEPQPLFEKSSEEAYWTRFKRTTLDIVEQKLTQFGDSALLVPAQHERLIEHVSTALTN